MDNPYGYIEKEVFDMTEDGTLVHQFTLVNANGLMMKVLTYGGLIRELWVSSKDDKFVDIVLGYDTLNEYEKILVS